VLRAAAYSAEKAIKENGEKAGAEVVKEVQDKIDALKTAQGGEDAALIKTATETLGATLSKIGEAMMKNQTPPEGAASPTSGPEGGDQTPPESPTDAEFKEKE
jgi:molecular chaperone DnaK